MTCDEMTIPCLMQYINCALYYYGHLNNDQIVSVHSQTELEDKFTSTATELAKKLECQTLDETNRQVSKKIAHWADEFSTDAFRGNACNNL